VGLVKLMEMRGLSQNQLIDRLAALEASVRTGKPIMGPSAGAAAKTSPANRNDDARSQLVSSFFFVRCYRFERSATCEEQDRVSSSSASSSYFAAATQAALETEAKSQMKWR